MAISCIIVDDEEMAVHHLVKYIAKVPFLEMKQYFTDPSKAIVYLESHSTNLVFVDIEMPNFSIDGMDFIKIMGNSQNYIFTTAYPEYALPSYNYNAIDFLHKPFSFERFLKAVQKAKTLIGNSIQENVTDTDGYTYVRVEGKLQRIDFTEICWVESERNTITIFTETNRFNSLLSISDIETRLPSNQFARIHKSYIIATNKAVIIDKDTVSIRRQSQLKVIPIGEAHRKNFIQSIDAKIIRKK